MRSLAARMFLTFAVALVAFGFVAIFAVGRMHALGTDLRLLSEGYLPLTRIAAQIDVKDWVTARALEVRAMDPAARRAFLPVARAHFPAVVKEKLAEARAVLARARGVASGNDARFLAEVAARVEALDARWNAYDQAARALFDALERSEVGTDDPALGERAEVVRRLEKGLSLDVKLFQAALDGQVADRVHAAERAERRSAVLIVIYSLVAAGVGVGAMLIGQRLLAPIRILTDGVKAVAAGDLTREVEVRSGDELGLLAREFNTMAASLDRQRADLLRAERLAAVGRISAQITHEIRNPLNAIGLNAELLAEELGSADVSAEARSLVQAIGREVDRLNAVTEEYLRFARLPKPVFAPEDVNEILAGLVDFVRPELVAARVELRLDLAAGLPPVRGDEAQLRAAFLNLLRNSREAMPHGGVVTVATRLADGDTVEAEVRDTGGGIPAEALPRIFDPFYSTKEKGTGLGLAFTQQVVQEHGGTIRCESAPGRGTVFAVRLPRAADERAVAGAGLGEALGA
ncbi:MAG TPA: ATP-binding protein [Anaeromyxobacteraceae bacterium]